MRLFIFLFVIISLNVTEAQTLKTLLNANGEEILIHEDSGFFSILNSGLLFYGESQGTGLRNFYFTNGDTTIALLPNEISNSVPIAKPIEKLYKEEFIFRAGDVWYKTKGSPATTSVFYDNSDENNPYQYELIYSSSKGDFTGPNLLIVAIEKSSQDTVTLFHNSNTGSTSPFQQRIRIFDGPHYGEEFIGDFFIASLYDDTLGIWSPVSVYRVHFTTWKPVLSIENRPFNKAERVSFNFWELLTQSMQ